MSARMRVAKTSLHMWEEPCISGHNGSGTVFFCGCNLGCVFCQNHMISRGRVGELYTPGELAEKMLILQEKGANNINLVTAGHYLEPVLKTLDTAKEKGLKIPVVYNTSSYESAENIRRLEGYVDVYLPDFKYVSSELSLRYSNAEDYFEVAEEALAEMVRQCGGEATFVPERPAGVENTSSPYGNDESLIMTHGVIVRHLLLPGCLEDSKRVVRYLLDVYGDDIYLSLMNQYTPLDIVKEKYPEIYRKVTSEEYEELLDYAIDLGLNNGFYQEGDVALESFIPDFTDRN